MEVVMNGRMINRNFADDDDDESLDLVGRSAPGLSSCSLTLTHTWQARGGRPSVGRRAQFDP